MSNFNGQARPRCICIKCREHFNSAMKFSRHLAECRLQFDIDFVFDLLNVDRTGECWLMNDPRGAKKVPKFGVEPKKCMKIHEIVAQSVHGPRPENLLLCHRCDNRRCLRPSHLYYGTHQDNSKDAWRNQRRTMSAEQLAAMQEGLRNSEKNQEAIVKRNREMAERQRGDEHWTRKDPEAMKRWVDAMKQGREAARNGLEEVMPR